MVKVSIKKSKRQIFEDGGSTRLGRENNLLSILLFHAYMPSSIYRQQREISSFAMQNRIMMPPWCFSSLFSFEQSRTRV
jgi:hypothetical protein